MRRLAVHKPIRDQVDLDSVDYLNFVIELHAQLGVGISEGDYRKLTSIDAAIDYLAWQIGSTPSRN